MYDVLWGHLTSTCTQINITHNAKEIIIFTVNGVSPNVIVGFVCSVLISVSPDV